MRLHTKPFILINQGIKTIEVRLNDKKRQALEVGDEIVFLQRSTPGQEARVSVIRLHKYPTFKELYQHIDPKQCGDQVPNDYKKLYEYYSPDEENKHGVIGIEFKLV